MLGSSRESARLAQMAGDFRNLKVWQKAHALAVRVDRIASTIRSARHAALKAQLVRAAMSIPANIAEGRHQESERDFARFLRYSVNSAYELEYHFVVAQDTGAIAESEIASLMPELIEVRKMLHGLLRKLNTGNARERARQDSP